MQMKTLVPFMYPPGLYSNDILHNPGHTQMGILFVYAPYVLENGGPSECYAGNNKIAPNEVFIWL